ncbi:MAG: motility associated factor glycosyltransferase family protein [Nitrospina sp.]|nr:motility associated factor glycosyltransferase family protein [Nitrospina sp.]
MNSSFLSKNLEYLKEKDPALFNKIIALKGSAEYEIANSRSGLPTISHTDSLGKKKQIHSHYDPEAEASRFLETLNAHEFENFIVIGLGLGYQVLEIIKKASTHAKILIFEKDPELFALSLREVDFSILLKHPGIKIFVNADPLQLETLLEPEQANFTLNNYCLVRHNSLVDVDSEYYGHLLLEIKKYFNESRINLKTQSIHSKLYYKNTFSNLNHWFESPGINCLKNSLPDIPAIICSAGPSLDKNIQLLKSARERFYLIAVATALKPLLHNGIQPDMVISIDPDEQTINSFDLEKNITDYWLVWSPSVPSAIPETFPEHRLIFDSEVYLAGWFKKYTEEKGNLGKISSVAHSAVKLAQYLACSPIILVGQDLSFYKQRQHCLHSFYYEKHMDKVSRLNPLSYWDHKKYLNFGPNLTQNSDLFGQRISSTQAMESYNHIFSNNHNDSQVVINATEGGLPIAGVQNLTLKETLYSYCKELVKNKTDSLGALHNYEKKHFKSLQNSLALQIQILKSINEKLKNLSLKYLNSEPQSSDDKRLFITEMQEIFKTIISNTETVLILQGYNFAGFSNWYRSNNQILRKKELSTEGSFLDEEFERDLKFLEVLVESVEYLMINFEKSSSQ